MHELRWPPRWMAVGEISASVGCVEMVLRNAPAGDDRAAHSRADVPERNRFLKRTEGYWRSHHADGEMPENPAQYGSSKRMKSYRPADLSTAAHPA
jgi:hypothetical protein